MDECETGVRGAAEEGVQVDEREAAVVQVQQKQEQVALLVSSHPETDADAEFRRGLEELVQDHLNTCMALASCSTSHEIGGADDDSASSSDDEDEDEDEEDLEDVVDGSSGSSYAPASFQSLSSEQQQQQRQEDVEVEDAAERRDVSAEDARHHDPAAGDESPGRQQSRIVQMWDTRAEEMITTLERQAREAELLALAGQHTVSMLDASFLQEAPTLRSECILERGHRRASSLVQLWRGIEEERRDSTRGAAPAEGTSPHEVEDSVSPETLQTDFSDARDVGAFAEEMSSGAQVDELVDSRRVESGSGWVDDGQEGENQTTAQAADIGEMDRERVRQIVQHWARQNAANDIEAEVRGGRDGLNPWLDQDERERVRHLVRAWMETSSQRSPGVQRPDMSDNASGGHLVAETGEAREIADAELGRQRQEASEMVVEVLMRIDRERQRELERLTELRTVSDFSQRNRLQYLLRGRFLRGAGAEDGQRTPSSASREIGQLQQQQAVSRLREAFRSRLESIVRSQASGRSAEPDLPRVQPAQERRRQDETAHTAERPAQVMSNQPAVAPSERVDSDSGLELRELLGRRSVTTILASDFRDRLDHLIRSLVHRQIHNPRLRPLDPENTTTRSPIPSPPPPPPPPPQRISPSNIVWRERRGGQPQPLANGFIPSPPPPPPPPQPVWPNLPWPRRAAHQRPIALELEASQNALREEMSRLHHGFSEMRHTLENLMDMHYDLHRSIRQEVAGALQRMYVGRAVPEEALDGNRWKSVEKGICCICCEKQINSLLYRCGHMCTCLECAGQIVVNSGTCPMCRAPIVEVVRAFTIA